ncbi:MAG: LysR family transcriptional regulator, partial [Pseudomonadota bacterium]
MDWDKLRIFHAVADAGSLTHAGDQLNLSQSAVSRQVRALEESLNAILFHRLVQSGSDRGHGDER